MERILLYQEKIGWPISLSFIEGRLYVKISQDDVLFEIGLFDKRKKEAVLDTLKRFLLITDIVEDLNLGNSM